MDIYQIFLDLHFQSREDTVLWSKLVLYNRYVISTNKPILLLASTSKDREADEGWF